MKLCCASIVLQMVAALLIAPAALAAPAADDIECNALQETFNRLYITGFREFDRLMDQCENTTSADSPERVSCIQQAGKKASGRIAIPMNQLKKDWRSVGCPGRPSEPDL